MSPASKFGNNDEVLSMFLVPKKMYNNLLTLLHDDEENKNELIGMNQSQTSNNNYIENAITFKKQQNDQNKNASTSNPQTNLQKPNSTNDQSAVLSNTLARSVSTYQPPLHPVLRTDTLPSNVSRDISLPESQAISKSKSIPKKTSTPLKHADVHQKYRNSPILQALNNRVDGKLVCPFTYCAKKYVPPQAMASHLIKDHNTEIAVRDRRVLSEAAKSSNTARTSIASSSGGEMQTPLSSKDSTNPPENLGARKKLFPKSYPKL